MIAAKLPEPHGLRQPKNPFSNGLANATYIKREEVRPNATR
jgi:hypothetical protein